MFTDPINTKHSNSTQDDWWWLIISKTLILKMKIKIDAPTSFNSCCNPQTAEIQCWLSPEVYKTHFDGHNHQRSHGFTLRAYACQIFNWGLKDLKAPTQSLIWCIWISRLPSVAEGVAYYGGHLVCHQCYLYHHKLLQVLFVCQVCILLWST